jgi:chromosomal replication initiator protein
VPRHRGKASTSASAYVLGSRVNKKQLWTSLLEELRTKTTKATYDMGLRNCSISSIDDDTVVIAAPSAFAREWVNERLLSIIRHAVKQLLGQDMNVRCEALTVGAGEPENGM